MCMLSAYRCEPKSATCGADSDNLPVAKSSGENQTLIGIVEILTDRHEAAELVKVDDEIELDLKRWPTSNEVIEELQQISSIACPMVIMGLLLYAKSMTSILFLGHLGELQLAGGALSIGFANITGYSVLSGLAMGMEPICGQAYGAKRWHLIGLSLQRMILILLCTCIPIGFLWLNMQRILLWCKQDKDITAMAGTYIVFCIPDLLAQAVLNPLKIYLRTQGITAPLRWCTALAVAFHLPINVFLVSYMRMNVEGVALAGAWTNFNLVIILVIYLWVSGRSKNTWEEGWSSACLKEWRPLLSLAIPSCVSVCLEWWWYELMIIFSGLLSNATTAVATMGILIQTTSLVYIFPSSLSLAVSARVGNELGANRPAKARFAMLVALGSATALGLISMTFTTTMRHRWGGLFTSDKQIIALTSLAMPIVGLCELGNCPQTTGCGVLRGSARPAIGAKINLGSFYLVGTPVAVMLSFLVGTGFAGLWLGLLAAQASCAALMLIVLLQTDWFQQAARAKQLTESAHLVDQTICRMIPSTRSAELEMQAEGKPLINVKICNNSNQTLALSVT